MNLMHKNITPAGEAGGFLQGVPKNTLWESFIGSNSYVRKINKASVRPLFDFAAKNEGADGYLSSPSYFLMTGRKGLWVYQKGESMVAFCWHPNVEGQILLFPPVGPNGIDMLAELINMEVQPTNGFRIARVPEEQASDLSQALRERCPGLTFMPKIEDMLDWIYPVHTFSTEKLANPNKREMEDYYKNVRRGERHELVFEKLDPAKHKNEIEVLTYVWVKAHPHFPIRNRDMLAEPSRFAFELMNNRRNLKVDGFMVFTQEGEPIGFNVWEMPTRGQTVANGITNISNTNFKMNPNDPEERPWKGIAELMFNRQAQMLLAAGVKELCLGGSETESLDSFKNKMAPIKSAGLRTIEILRSHPRM